MGPAFLRSRKRPGVVPDEPRHAQRRLLVCRSSRKGSFEMLHGKKAQKLGAETGEETTHRRRRGGPKGNAASPDGCKLQEAASMLHPMSDDAHDER